MNMFNYHIFIDCYQYLAVPIWMKRHFQTWNIYKISLQIGINKWTFAIDFDRKYYHRMTFDYILACPAHRISKPCLTTRFWVSRGQSMNAAEGQGFGSWAGLGSSPRLPAMHPATWGPFCSLCLNFIISKMQELG